MSEIDVRCIPLEKANEHNKSCTLNTDFLATAITPSYPPSMLRIFVCSQTAAKFKTRVTKATNTQTLTFNADTNLTANVPYMFTMLVHSGDTINFQFDGTLTMSVFRVQEIMLGTQ
uniref:Uncharacterized protein n=1 Tax=viral metagenome TaxID=1070528 RepID=A0A6M3XUN9_9ZZZZ